MKKYMYNELLKENPNIMKTHDECLVTREDLRCHFRNDGKTPESMALLTFGTIPDIPLTNEETFS